MVDTSISVPAWPGQHFSGNYGDVVLASRGSSRSIAPARPHFALQAIDLHRRKQLLISHHTKMERFPSISLLLRTSHDKRAPSLPHPGSSTRPFPPSLSITGLLHPPHARPPPGLCDDRKPPCLPAYEGDMATTFCFSVAYLREQKGGWQFRMVETEMSSCIEETPELGPS